jgi:SAM-dependent methyltransferase
MSSLFSFRDPSGRLFTAGGRLLRVVNDPAIPDAMALLNSNRARQCMDTGHLVKTRVLDSTEAADLLEGYEGSFPFSYTDVRMVLEHERVDFPSFPCEWPSEMLWAAGTLTLDLAEAFLHDGIGLKDATPSNVLFRGPAPIFVDILSFERRDPTDPIWLPYAQFVRTFLLPLLVDKYFGLPSYGLFFEHPDGVRPDDIYRLLGPFRKLVPPFLTLISLPVWFARKLDQEHTAIYERKLLNDTKKAMFVLQTLFKRLRRHLQRLAPAPGRSTDWSGYADSSSYSERDLLTKESFVEAMMTELAPGKVLDAGCNTGYFSTIVAKAGAKVVAIDCDPVVVGEVWRNASRDSLDILPLVINLARPTPALGWRNSESSSFLTRAHQSFDAVLMLALIHHLVVTERIPLAEIVELAALLTRDILLAEYVGPEDPMFRSLTRGRDRRHIDLTKEVFETTFRRHFEIVRAQQLADTGRWLYLMRKKATVGV